MNKKIPLWILLLVIWIALIVVVLFGWDVWRIKNGRGIQSATDRVVITIASYPTLVKESLKELGQPSKLVSGDFFPEIDRFQAAKGVVDSNYVLLASFDRVKDQSAAKLIRLSDQATLYEWTPDYKKIIALIGGRNKDWDTRNIHNLRLYHPMLLPDGSLLFNTLESPLIRIDKESKFVWAVDGIYHHTEAMDANGNFWAPSIIKPSRFLAGILRDFRDDALTEISPAGKVLFQRSVAQILMDNGYNALMLSGLYEKDLLHLNSIFPALTSGAFWQKGDLLVSLRNRSTVFLYRPATNKITWLKTGPWLNQHDARFIDSARISVFGNDMVRVYGDEKLVHSHNQEYIFDFRTGKTDTPYAAFFKKAGIATTNEGLARVLKNGDLFVEETNRNRLLRGNATGINWQFVDRIDKHSLAALSCSDFITKAAFEKLKFLKKQ